MTTRKNLIIQSLMKGNKIIRLWKGPSSNGRLSHQLDGIKNLREKEVDELRKEKLVVPEKGVGAFRPLVFNEK